MAVVLAGLLFFSSCKSNTLSQRGGGEGRNLSFLKPGGPSTSQHKHKKTDRQSLFFLQRQLAQSMSSAHCRRLSCGIEGGTERKKKSNYGYFCFLSSTLKGPLFFTGAAPWHDNCSTLSHTHLIRLWKRRSRSLFFKRKLLNTLALLSPCAPRLS